MYVVQANQSERVCVCVCQAVDTLTLWGLAFSNGDNRDHQLVPIRLTIYFMA